MNLIRMLCLSLLLTGCSWLPVLHTPVRPVSSLTGSAFYTQVAAMKWRERDSVAVKEIFQGNIPSFLKKLSPVTTRINDPITGQKIEMTFYVTPDYLSVGSNEDWARINITPMAAQRIADSFHCFLPTKKMVDDIYAAATIKLEPVPLYAFRDSSTTMWHHHLIIEGQRKGRSGVIAGIKKDVVLSGKLMHESRNDRVAIYGWHQLNGKAIQPLYTGHVNWWVDYSQGIRLVYQEINVNGKWMHYTDVLKSEKLKTLLCDEAFCDCFRY